MTFSFSTAEVRPAERFDFFHEAVAKSYIRSELSVPDTRSFRGEIKLQLLDRLSLSVIETSPLYSNAPRPKRETSVPDVVFMMLVTEGYSRIVQGGRETETRVGEMSLLDTASPFTVMIPEGATHLVLEMPRAELEARIGSVESVTGRRFTTRSTEVALTAGYMRKLLANPPSQDADLLPAVERQTLDLFALAFSDGSSDVVKRLSSPASVTRLRLHHAIDFSVGEGHLSCEDVANMAGISTRYANMLLAQEGMSLERLLMRKRLERSREMLADPGNLHRLIGEIARAAGFDSASHFARSFKSAYGMTARDFRYQAMHAYVESPNAMSNIARLLV